jgi:hypothetical protein
MPATPFSIRCCCKSGSVIPFGSHLTELGAISLVTATEGWPVTTRTHDTCRKHTVMPDTPLGGHFDLGSSALTDWVELISTGANAGQLSYSQRRTRAL